MSLTVRSLYRDTVNFLRNHAASLLLWCFICALVSLALSGLLLPNKAAVLQLVDSLNALLDKYAHQPDARASVSQLSQLLPAEHLATLWRYSWVTLVVMLINNALLTGGVLTIIQYAAQQPPLSLGQLPARSLPRALHVLVLMLVIMVALTLVSFVCLLIHPWLALLAAVLGSIMLLPAPVVQMVDTLSPWRTLSRCLRFSWHNIGLLLPIVAGWLALTLLVSAPLQQLKLHFPLPGVLLSATVNNGLAALMLVYCYRLYTQRRGVSLRKAS